MIVEDDWARKAATQIVTSVTPPPEAPFNAHGSEYYVHASHRCLMTLPRYAYARHRCKESRCTRLDIRIISKN
ncbi:hypothetical protein [Paraburkholderia oxyphila]|uniref:hypothetical protein n=1 Tax=Paraburkholderia oxyphila TaxID=614212 RepID=UPI0012EE95F1|nr:hypothetical protein [Paraburkholderia oxyphila]